MWGAVPGGYRNTINDNVVLIEMIETLDGAVAAREIASLPGVTRSLPPAEIWAISRATGRARPIMSASSTSCTTRRWQRAKRLCGPFAWRDRPDFTCFQNQSETAPSRAEWPPNSGR